MTTWEELRRRVSLAGWVLDAKTQAPLPGALVRLERAPAGVDAPWEQLAQTLSRRDGRYLFTNLPAGRYRLQANAPHLGRRYDASPPSEVELPAAGDPALLALKLSLPPTRIVGTVTHCDPSKPATGTRVWLQGDTRAVLTDAEGNYVLSDLTARTPTVVAAADGCKPTSSAAIALIVGQDHQVDIRLEPALAGKPPAAQN